MIILIDLVQSISKMD